ncbi:MAG: lipid II flippase MurJ [Chloroflexia bacterium]
MLISGGALSAAFIPVFTQLLDSGDEERAQRMAAGVFGMVAVVVTLLVAISWVFAPEIVNRAWRASPTRRRRLAVNLMRILLLSP